MRKAADDQLILTYYNKEEDEEGMKRVVRETRRLYTDQGWSVGTCEEAFWRVWTNKKDDLRRRETGKAVELRIRGKNNKRVTSKLVNRKKVLSSIDWPEKIKVKVLPLLRKELTSPMVSDEDDDNLLLSTGFTRESKKLASYKRHLDNQRLFSATARGRKNMKKWARHPSDVTESLAPQHLPSWAVADDLDITVDI